MELEYKTDMLIAEVSKFLLLQACHVDIVNEYRTAVRVGECPHNLQKGSLSSTTWAYYADNLTFLYQEIDAFQNLQRTKTLGDIFDSYHILLLNLSNLLKI